VFTQTQFDVLGGVVNACRHRLQQIRVKDILMKKDEILPLFVREEHRDLMVSAAKVATDDNVKTLGVNVLGTYTNAFMSEPIITPMRFTARTSDLSFLVPDYAGGTHSDTSYLPMTLPPHLQKYVDARLSLAVEFGLLTRMLKWFADDHLLVPQMAYLFPPIIQLLSVHEKTKAIAERYSKPSVPSTVPQPPGMREAFSLVESTLMRALAMLDKPNVNPSMPSVGLDVRFSEKINVMGWTVTLS